MKVKLTLDQFKVQYRIARLSGKTHAPLSTCWFAYLKWYDDQTTDEPVINQMIHEHESIPNGKPNKQDYPDYKLYRQAYLRWYDKQNGSDRHKDGYYQRYYAGHKKTKVTQIVIR